MVAGITDGDTLKARCKGQQKLLRVRLSEIDAPEKDQPFGIRSTQSLAEMCAGRQVVLHVRGKDRYGRTLARVVCDGVDANEEQVRRGMAWVYRSYSHSVYLLVLESGARAARRGLWADSKPVPPWEFRKRKARR